MLIRLMLSERCDVTGWCLNGSGQASHWRSADGRTEKRYEKRE